MNELQAKALIDAISVAGLVRETGGDWRTVIRRRKNRHLGKLRKAFERILKFNDDDFEYILLKGVDRDESIPSHIDYITSLRHYER